MFFETNIISRVFYSKQISDRFIIYLCYANFTNLLCVFNVISLSKKFFFLKTIVVVICSFLIGTTYVNVAIIKKLVPE